MFLLITLARGLILYIFIIICMRFMGKRQLGELQPTELVITILLSEIASIPMQDNDVPMINSILAVLLLVCLEIINSVIIMKSNKIRYLLQGMPAVVINDGKLDQKKLKALRFTADDILDQMRQKDVFDISTVQYAVVETNGSLSVMKKPQYDQPVNKDLNIKSKKQGIPVLVVNDGEFINKSIRDYKIDKNKIESVLENEKTDVSEALIMLIDKYNNYTLIKKTK